MENGYGHNSGESPAICGIAAELLRSTVERYERLDEEVKALRADQKDILSNAKANGLDVKIIKKLIALRRMEEQERIETEELIDLYKHALGMG